MMRSVDTLEALIKALFGNNVIEIMSIMLIFGTLRQDYGFSSGK